MKINGTCLDDIFTIDFISFKDNRGEFVKTIHEDTFKQYSLEYRFTESFYSVSHKNVIRGMHFQSPPHDHVKLVYVITGSIIDVVLDLRLNSNSYGKFFAVELNEKNRKGIYIGSGFAHGFLSLEDNTIVEYHTSTIQNKESEGGILYNSFGMRWAVEEPVASLRDNSFAPFEQFNSPFK